MSTPNCKNLYKIFSMLLHVVQNVQLMNYYFSGKSSSQLMVYWDIWRRTKFPCTMLLMLC